MNNVFEYLYHTSKETEYDPKWANGTGYFDHIVDAGLTEASRFKDEYGRRVVAIPSGDKVIVMNERYRKKEGNIEVIVIQNYYV